MCTPSKTCVFTHHPLSKPYRCNAAPHLYALPSRLYTSRVDLNHLPSKWESGNGGWAKRRSRRLCRAGFCVRPCVFLRAQMFTYLFIGFLASRVIFSNRSAAQGAFFNFTMWKCSNTMGGGFACCTLLPCALWAVVSHGNETWSRGTNGNTLLKKMQDTRKGQPTQKNKTKNKHRFLWNFPEVCVVFLVECSCVFQTLFWFKRETVFGLICMWSRECEYQGLCMKWCGSVPGVCNSVLATILLWPIPKQSVQFVEQFLYEQRTHWVRAAEGGPQGSASGLNKFCSKVPGKSMPRQPGLEQVQSGGAGWKYVFILWKHLASVERAAKQTWPKKKNEIHIISK